MGTTTTPEPRFENPENQRLWDSIKAGPDNRTLATTPPGRGNSLHLTAMRAAYSQYAKWCREVQHAAPVEFDQWMLVIEWGTPE